MKNLIGGNQWNKAQGIGKENEITYVANSSENAEISDNPWLLRQEQVDVSTLSYVNNYNRSNGIVIENRGMFPITHTSTMI